MERSSSSHNSRSSCTGGKLGCMKPKENLGPSAASCIKGETGALATLRMPRNDLGSSDTDLLKVSICCATLKVGSPVAKSRFQLHLMIQILIKRGTYKYIGGMSDLKDRSKANYPPTCASLAQNGETLTEPYRNRVARRIDSHPGSKCYSIEKKGRSRGFKRL